MILFLHDLLFYFIFIRNHLLVTFDVITLYYLYRIHNICKCFEFVSLHSENTRDVLNELLISIWRLQISS